MWILYYVRIEIRRSALLSPILFHSPIYAALPSSPASKGCTHARTATTRLYDTRGPSSGDILDGIGPTGRPAKLFLSPQKIASGPPSIRAARLAKTVRTVTDVAYKEGRAAEKKRVSMKEKRERAREDT